MTRRLSLDGYLEILSHEAIVIRPYKDSVGTWTIGVGHTAAAGGLDPEETRRELTIEEAVQLFIDDIAKFEKDVDAVLSPRATQEQFDAAVSFHFNTGKIASATWVKQFNEGDTKGAIASIMNWKKPKEIIPRRKKEQALFAGKGYSHNDEATVYSANAAGNVLWSQGKRMPMKRGLVRLLQKRSPKPEPAPPPPPPPDVPKPPEKPHVSQPGASNTGWYIGLFIVLAVVAAAFAFVILN